MRPLSILEIFRPMLFLSKILGTHPLKTHKNIVIFCRFKLFYSFICLLIYITIVILFFLRCVNKFPNKMFITMMAVKCFGCMAVLLTIMFSSYANYRKFLKMMESICEIDLQLGSFAQEERLARSTYRHRKQLIVLMSLNLLYNVVGNYLVGLTQRLNPVVFFVTFTYPRVVVTNMNIIYCVVALMIEDRFKIVNEMFHELDSRSNTFCVDVTKLVIVHRLLVKVSQLLNSVYALQFLLWITQCFVLVVNDLHLGIHILYFQHLPFNFQNTFAYVKNCISYVFDLYYLSKRSARLCFEVISIYQIYRTEQKI
jgi:hypothetical protein